MPSTAVSRGQTPSAGGLRAFLLSRRRDIPGVCLGAHFLGGHRATTGTHPPRCARPHVRPGDHPACRGASQSGACLPLPGGAFLLAQALRWHALRRLPLTFGWMAKRPIPHELIDAWLRPLQTQPGVRRDLARFVHTFDRGEMRAAADGLRRFERPALVVWAPEDRINP
jgi:hypothetical protein